LKFIRISFGAVRNIKFDQFVWGQSKDLSDLADDAGVPLDIGFLDGEDICSHVDGNLC